MSEARLKKGYFVVEGINSFATTYFFYYLYFYMQTAHGFDNRANLVLAALNGGVFAVAAFWGGRFAERYGYFRALKVGFGVMMLAIGAGGFMTTAAGMVVIMCVGVAGMCFTWPTLEALVSHGETRSGLQRMVGIYNVVWAGTGAVAFFIGGLLLDKLGLKSLFVVPVVLNAVLLGLTFWLEGQARRVVKSVPETEDGLEADPEPHPHAHANPKAFRQMAWLANPLAYIAINTLVAVLPGVASRLGLSTTLAGFCCSVWCFGRLAGFTLCWVWDGWHYKFRWMLAAYCALVATFAVILMVPNLGVLVAAQVCFGLALGLIYSSSLFYSMDLSDTKGEHGGIHEAAIGLGNFVGPAVGAVSLSLWPQFANSGAVAVSGLLVLGLGGLTAIWRQGRRPAL